jgi:hypothetical protein
MRIKIIVLYVVIIISLVFTAMTSDSATTTSSNLIIVSPEKINESYPFFITIQADNHPVVNVTVRVENQINLTNETGIAGFIAPRVLPNENKTLNISAYKEGYNSTLKKIMIINIPQVYPVLETAIIEETQNFTLTVIDDEGRIVDNATVNFDNQDYFTNGNGTIILRSPDVDRTTTYIINISKQDYIDNSITIRILPRPSFENVFGAYIAISIIITIILTASGILLIKYYQRWRLNR